MVDTEKLGEWAFLAGLAIAVLAGLADMGAVGGISVATVLIVLGVITGFVSIGAKETGAFLTATIALLVATNVSGLGGLDVVGSFIGNILTNINRFVAPAAVIIAVKYVVELAKG